MCTQNTECFVEDKQVVELDRLNIYKKNQKLQLKWTFS